MLYYTCIHIFSGKQVEHVLFFFSCKIDCSKSKQQHNKDMKMIKRKNKSIKIVVILSGYCMALMIHNLTHISFCKFFLYPASNYTEPKKKLSRDFNWTVSTYVYINSFYSYLLLHNNLKWIHQSSFTVWTLSISFEVGVDSIFLALVMSMPTASIANSLAATTHWGDEIINLSLGYIIPLF